MEVNLAPYCLVKIINVALATQRSVVSKIVGERRNRKIYHYNRTIVKWVVKSGGLR